MKKKTIVGFLAGAVFGTTLGVLFAPKSGKETRKDLKKLAKKAKDIDLDDVREFVIEKSANIEEKLSKLSKERVLKEAKKKSKEIQKDIANLYDYVKDISEDVMQDSVIKLKKKAEITIEKILEKLKED